MQLQLLLRVIKVSRMRQRKTPPPAFGRRIVELRKKHQMTQEDLAKILKTQKSMVNYYENRAQNPTIETISKIAAAFGLTNEELMNPIDEKSKKTGAPSRLEKLFHQIQELSPYKQNVILDMMEGAISRK